MAGTAVVAAAACRAVLHTHPHAPAHAHTRGPCSAKDLCVNGQRVTVRYNDTCHFYQPPRAHHCSVNDNCIERFDHHCPWVGTTIGRVRVTARRIQYRPCVACAAAYMHTPPSACMHPPTPLTIGACMRALAPSYPLNTHIHIHTLLLTPCICAAVSSCCPSLSIIAFLCTAQLSHLSSVHLLHQRLHRLGVWRLPGQPVYQAHRADSRSSSRPSCRDRRIQCLACNTQ